MMLTKQSTTNLPAAARWAVASRRPTLAQLLGRRIVALREEAGLTQEKLGWEVGMTSKGFLSRVENGRTLPSLQLLERIAARLDVEVYELLLFPELGGVHEEMEKLRGKLISGRVNRRR